MSGKLTKDQLEVIRQRAAQATGGKWVAEVNDGLMDHRTYYRIFSDIETEYSEVTFLIHKLENKEDADFIANAHQDIPTLLDHIAELQGKIDLYESYAQECDYYAILTEMGDENDNV
ncbi:hypothetical protein FA037_05845 [Bacillus amyloliquefaciens]|uniref:hypothetical protein n=1 Tax=Bacillus amyloliquefaciens TaxID=1390 RepID=UPI0010AB7AD5|nr:hypothetical protein [Bacillus amyloliquefaciens]TJZ71439.1 hypothetical protein FA037_05845 [Bacillus amyloliquefaciens]